MWTLLKSIKGIYERPSEDWKFVDDGSDPIEAAIFIVCVLVILWMV